MAASNRSWRGGKQAARKTSAKSKALVPILFLVVLIGVVIWVCWPKPPVAVHLLTITGTTDVKSNVLDAAAAADLSTVQNVFQAVAEQSIAYHAREPLSPQQAESLTDLQAQLGDAIIVLFLHARPSVVVDEGQPDLELHFGSDPNPVSVTNLFEGIAALSPRQAIVLMEISHEFPELFGQSSADFGQEVIAEKIDKLREEFPHLPLTVVTSAAPYEISFPYQLPESDSSAKSSKETFPCQRFHGTAFGHFVAEVFQKSQADSVESLIDSLTTEIKLYASQHGGQQTATVYEVQSPESGVQRELLASNYTIAISNDAPASNNVEEESQAPPLAPEATPAPATPTKLELLMNLDARIREFTAGGNGISLTLAEWRQVQQRLRDALYLLHNQSNVKADDFHELAGQYIDDISATIERVENAQRTQIDPALLNWVAPVNFESLESAAVFQDLLTQVIDPNLGDSRDQKLVDRFEQPESRLQLVSAFVSYLDSLKHFESAQTPEELQGIHDVQKDLLAFFTRFAKKTEWRKPDWPALFLLFDEIIRHSGNPWSADEFAAIRQICLLRCEALQFASGLRRDGKLRIENVQYDQLVDDVQAALTSLTAAERWLFVGASALPLVEQEISHSEQKLSGLRDSLKQSKARADSAAATRVALLTNGQTLGHQFDALVNRSQKLEPFKHLNQFDGLTKNLIQDVTGSRISWEPAERFLDLMLARSSADSLQRLETDIDGALGPFTSCLPDELRLHDRYSQFGGSYGIFLSYAAIECLSLLAPHEQQAATLKQSWLKLANSLGSGAELNEMLGLREDFRRHLASALDELGSQPLAQLTPPDEKRVLATLRRDLALRAQINSQQYDSVKLNAGQRPAAASPLRLGQSLQLGTDMTAPLQVELAPGEQLYVHADDVRVRGGEVTPIAGWSKVRPQNGEFAIQADPEKFHGNSELILARVNEDSIVTESMTIQVTGGFVSNGWKLRFQTADIHLELKSTLIAADQQVLDLPPNSGPDPLPIQVHLVKPKEAFDRTVTCRLYHLKRDRELGDPIWPASIELTFPDGSNETIVPLLPAPSEGELDPTLKLDLTSGFALEIQPQQSGATANESVILKVAPRFVPPIDAAGGNTGGYIDIEDPTYSTRTHQLTMNVRRKPEIPAYVLPPKVIPLRMELSRDLQPYLAKQLPAVPDLPTEPQPMVIQFRPEVETFIENAKDKHLEFGLSVGDPMTGEQTHVTRWRLTGSEVTELGNLFNQPEIRTELSLSVPETMSIGDFYGIPVIQRALTDKEKQSVQFLIEPHIYGYGPFQNDNLSLEQRAVKYQVRINRVGEDSKFFRDFEMTDTHSRTVAASPAATGNWMLNVATRSVQVANPLISDFNLGEGTYELESQLIVGGTPVTQAVTRFLIENSEPVIQIAPEKPAHVGQDYVNLVTLHDPQTGIKEAYLKLQEAVVPIKIDSDSTNAFQPVEGKITIPKEILGTIPPGEGTQRKALNFTLVTINGVGMQSEVKYPLTLVQSQTIDNRPKVRDLVINLPLGTFDVTLTGPDEKQTKKEKQKGSVKFSNLAPGKYHVDWVLLGFDKQGATDIDLQVPNPGMPPHQETVR